MSPRRLVPPPPGLITTETGARVSVYNSFTDGEVQSLVDLLTAR